VSIADSSPWMPTPKGTMNSAIFICVFNALTARLQAAFLGSADRPGQRPFGHAALGLLRIG